MKWLVDIKLHLTSIKLSSGTYSTGIIVKSYLLKKNDYGTLFPYVPLPLGILEEDFS